MSGRYIHVCPWGKCREVHVVGVRVGGGEVMSKNIVYCKV